LLAGVGIGAGVESFGKVHGWLLSLATPKYTHKSAPCGQNPQNPKRKIKYQNETPATSVPFDSLDEKTIFRFIVRNLF
jgi:hypothetical protein